MPARSAIASRVAASWPFSRISCRAASSRLARVRSRLSPFVFGCWPIFSAFVISVDFIMSLFYKSIIKSRGMNVNEEEQLQKVLQKSVDEGQVAGAAVLVHRKGETRFAAGGWRDIE